MYNKRFVIFLLSIILLSSFAFTMSAEVGTGSFTHPEVGEFMTIHVGNQLADFEIYGFTYYRVIPYEESYRGLWVNAPELINDKNASFSEALNAIFDSAEGKAQGHAPIVSLEYTGYAKQYSEVINALNRDERIKALRILNGMDGAEGYQGLKDIPGFETVDVTTMQNQYQEYKIRIDGEEYPYRVLMFFFEEEDWYEYYNERYHFVQIDGDWRLIRITKEYSDEYNQRSKYIHGFEGLDFGLIDDTNFEALRGTKWGMSLEEVSALVKTKDIEPDAILLKNEQIYRVPTDLTFHFTDNKLDSVTYVFHDEQQFYSIFVSLYIRYFDPATISADGSMTWCQNDLDITLSYDGSTPTLTFSPVSAANDN